MSRRTNVSKALRRIARPLRSPPSRRSRSRSSPAATSFRWADGRKATLTYTDDARAAYERGDALVPQQGVGGRASALRGGEASSSRTAATRRSRSCASPTSTSSRRSTRTPSRAYREFVQNHHTDRDVEYARYRIAKALFRDIDDTLLLPPQEERDQATTLEAYKELGQFLREYPKGALRRRRAHTCSTS